MPERWGPGVFRLAAPGGVHLLVRRHGAPELAFWLPAGLAPHRGEPFGFHLAADASYAARVRAVKEIARGLGPAAARRKPFDGAHRHAAMLYVYDAVRAGLGLRAIGDAVLGAVPADWRSSSVRSDLRRLAEDGERLVAAGYRALLDSRRPLSEDA